MKDNMMLYGVEMSTRYTRRQKELFLAFIVEQCKRLNIRTAFETRHSAFRHLASIEIGNIEKAKTVICACYDTPEKTYVETRYYPLNPDSNVSEARANLIAKIIMGLVGGFLIFYLVRGFSGYKLVFKILSSIAIGIIVAVLYFVSRGIPNQVNFSRNSAAVALIMKLAEEMKNDRTAFVLLDNTVNSYEGLGVLKEKIGDDKTVIYLDNLSYGNRCVIAHTPGMDVSGLMSDGFTEKEYDQPANALSYFSRMIQISCGEVYQHQLIVRKVGTNKDYEVDMKRLEKLHDLLSRYING